MYRKKYDLKDTLFSLYRTKLAKDLCCENQLCKDLGTQQSSLFVQVTWKNTYEEKM